MSDTCSLGCVTMCDVIISVTNDAMTCYCLQGAVGSAQRSSLAVFTELWSSQVLNTSTTVSAF